jgi:glutamate racemase
VIGVVEPGARAAVKATVNRRVGVIGTVGTVNSGAYSTAVHALDAGVTVFSAPTPRFVEVVEQGLRLGDGSLEEWLAETSHVYIRPSFYEMARHYLDPLKRSGIDTLVLGCTHFPLLAEPIQQVVGPNVRLISSAEETAREVADTLAARGHLAEAGAARLELFATTGDAEEFRGLGARVLGRPLAAVEYVALESLEGLLTDELRAKRSAFEGGEACA